MILWINLVSDAISALMSRKPASSRGLESGLATGVTQELGYSLNADAKSFFRLIHKGAKVLKITGKQMGCLTSQRRLENRLVLLCKTFREGEASSMINKVDSVLKCAKTIQGVRKFSLQVAARFFQRIGTREQFPVTLSSKLNNQCGFSSRIMCRREQYVCVETQPHFFDVVSVSTIRARS